MPTTTQLRSDVAELTGDAERELLAALRGIASATVLEEALRDVLPDLIDDYGAGAATLSADWYDETRAEMGVTGRFTAIPADVPDAGAFDLIRWAQFEARSLDTMRPLIVGGMQRRVANFSRLTVTRSSIADPRAKGWRRVGSPRCDFCRMLISRGAVYREATAHFDAHDHCNCGAEPAWR